MAVEKIRNGRPLLTDIAGQMRDLAGKIERGELKPDLCAVVLRFAAPGLPTSITTYGWGIACHNHEFDGLMLNAAIGRGAT